MDAGLLEFIKIVLQYAIAPVGIIAWWSFRKFDHRLEQMESRLSKAERINDVLDTKINDIRKDLAHIQQGIDTLLRERRTQ